jgi:hypothetical protein
MALLVAKKKGNQLYYYYYVVESARVDGQPRIVHQAYLGTAEKVAALDGDHGLSLCHHVYRGNIADGHAGVGGEFLRPRSCGAWFLVPWCFNPCQNHAQAGALPRCLEK